jgi:hypothetical protein
MNYTVIELTRTGGTPFDPSGSFKRRIRIDTTSRSLAHGFAQLLIEEHVNRVIRIEISDGQGFEDYELEVERFGTDLQYYIGG